MSGGASFYSLSVGGMWLGFLLEQLLTLKRFTPQLWLCSVLPSYLNLRINKKGIIIYTPIFMFEGVNAIQGICLVFHGSIPSQSNNCKYIF
jgi:hypothetical protein